MGVISAEQSTTFTDLASDFSIVSFERHAANFEKYGRIVDSHACLYCGLKSLGVCTGGEQGGDFIAVANNLLERKAR